MINTEDDFKFYSRIAKSLAFDLPDEWDRLKAIKWIKTITTTTGKAMQKTKAHCLNLLLVCLQRKRLVEPFDKNPVKDKPLNSYRWSYQPSDIARNILHKERISLGKPPVSYDISGNLCEYVAYQTIPQFGSHFYYAYSPQELKFWDNLDNIFVPKSYKVTTISFSDVERETGGADVERETGGADVERETGGADDDDDNEDGGNLDEAREHKPTSQFTDASVMDQNGAIKSDFIAQNPSAKDAGRRECIKELVRSGVLDRQDLAPFRRSKIKSPHVEVVDTTCDKSVKRLKNDRSPVQKKLTEAIQNESERKSVLTANDRLAMLRSIPRHYKEGSSRTSYQKGRCSQNDSRSVLAPKVSRKVTSRPSTRPYSPEEFALSRDEPVLQSDCSGRSVSQSHRSFGDNLEESWSRSYQAMMASKKLPASRGQSAGKQDFLNRIERLKKTIRPRHLLYDDTDIQYIPEEEQFKRFMQQELPDNEIGAEDDMNDFIEDYEKSIEDIYGRDRVSNRLSLDALEKAELMLQSEMNYDDIFADDPFENSEILFKELTVKNDQEYDRTQYGKCPSKVGKRVLTIPGNNPFEQYFVEEDGVHCSKSSPGYGQYSPDIFNRRVAMNKDRASTSDYAYVEPQMPPNDEAERDYLQSIRDGYLANYYPDI